MNGIYDMPVSSELAQAIKYERLINNHIFREMSIQEAKRIDDENRPH